MTLTVEDGTGLSTADALISVATADSYHASRGNDTWLGGTTDKEEAIRRASSHMTTSFSWKGSKVNGRSQTMAWPRYGVTDKEGWSVDSDEVPQEVQDACCELALQELTTPGTLSPVVTYSQKAKRQKVGPIEIEYANTTSDATLNRPVVTKVQDLISGLISGSNSTLSGSSRRV